MRPLLALALAAVLTACSSPPTPSTGPAGLQLDRVVIDQAGALLTGAGQTAKLTATAMGANGGSLTVTWRSSRPEHVIVAADGTLTAATDLGSAVIFAEAGAASAAVTVIVAEPVAGAVLVSDDQVLSGPELVKAVRGEPGPDGEPGMPTIGSRMRATLAAAVRAEPGATLVPTGSAAVGGRVLAVQPGADGTVVDYELVPLPDLLARYSIDLDIPVGDEEVTEGAADTAGEGAVTPLQVAGAGEASAQQLARRAAEAKVEKELVKAGPLTCKASAGASLKSSHFSVTTKHSLDLKFATEKDTEASVPAFTRVLLTGPLALDVSGGLTVQAGFEGKVECGLVFPIKIPLPGVLAIVQIVIPLGLGAEVEGKVKAIDIKVGPTGHLGTTVSIGFECNETDCFAIKDHAPDDGNGVRWTQEIKLVRDARVEASVSANIVAGLGAQIPTVGSFEAIEAKAGPVQSWNLAFPDTQAREADYASAYDLRFKASVAPAGDLKSLLHWFTGGAVGVDLSVNYTPEKPIAASPTGRLSAEKPMVQVDKPIRLFIDLEAQGLQYGPFGPNVEAIVISRREKDGSLREIGRERMTSSTTHVEHTWTPTREFVGMNELVAFVDTTWLPPVPLEVAADSTTYVEVVDACLAELPTPGPVAPTAAPGATSRPGEATPTPPDPCVADGTLVQRNETHLDTGPDHNLPTRTNTVVVTTMSVQLEAAPDDPLTFATTSGSWAIEYAFDHWQDRRYNNGADGCILTEQSSAAFAGSWDERSFVQLSYDPETLIGVLSLAVAPSGPIQTTTQCPGLMDAYTTSFDAADLLAIVGLYTTQGRREGDRIVFDFDETRSSEDTEYLTNWVSIKGRLSVSPDAPQ